MSERIKRASDHRACVLEAVATSPQRPSAAQIIDEVLRACPSFRNRNVASAMVSTLRREGLIGMGDDGGYFVTKAGLVWLTEGTFDRLLPAEYTKPKRKRKGKA